MIDAATPSRRDLLATAGAATLLAATPALAAAPKQSRFVTRAGTRFILDGKPYSFAGTNMWYGPWVGADTPYGDRDRLKRELDRLAAIGVTNIRINASSEDSPLKNSVKPALHGNKTPGDPGLLGGLDFTLAEMAKRGMKAVLYLTNFWEWSGGMMTYLSYVNGGRFINMNDPAHPWPEFPDMVSQFYSTPAAIALYHDWIRTIVGRTNAITGAAYRDDPTIMAWQLANEPRPAGSDAIGKPALPAFQAWVASSAALIKSLDRNHLVCTGSEGLKGSLESAETYTAEHAIPAIDYCTAHIWPLNWSWIDAHDLAGTQAAGAAKVDEYIQQHTDVAKALGKPLVIEEFGYPRDGGGYDTDEATRYKDAYYKLIYDAVEASAKAGGPIAGSNFWAWNGEGRAVHGDHRFRPGDTVWLGDPPHEPQGWYGVFDSDASTRAVIAAHAKALTAIT